MFFIQNDKCKMQDARCQLQERTVKKKCQFYETIQKDTF